MTVSTGTGGVGTRHINTDWPVDEGLELGTTKRDESDPGYLIPEEKSLLRTYR